MIDELVETGVPAVAAAEAGSPRGRWMISLYILIPLIAVGLLTSLGGTGANENSPSGGGRSPDPALRGASNNELVVTAQNISFDTGSLTLKAGRPTVIHFKNEDAPSVQHNVALYKDPSAQDPVFQGEIIAGGTGIDYEFTAPKKGEYFFRCNVHPSMNGTVIVEP